MAPVPATSATGHKRKAATIPAAVDLVGTRKRQKFQDVRNIATQTADRALSRSGELNVASFIQAREFEINALDNSMRKARQNLTARAFQQVPRHLRRRTASHNAQKVPRRLRRRAQREMKDDNTPLVTSKTRAPSAKLRLRLETAKALKTWNQRRGAARRANRKGAKKNPLSSGLAKDESQARTPRIKKNTLVQPSAATDKFKRRQISKTWLPTHLWHAKRARMTRPIEPLWRMALPLTPSEKSYRPSHRAAGNRGAIAWDTSYMSTIGCLGTETALEGLLKAVRFAGEGWAGARYHRWKTGARAATSWACESKDGNELVAPITVVWAPKLAVVVGDQHPSAAEKQADGIGAERVKTRARLDSRILIRLHPSAFHEFWLQLLKVAKAQKPQVLVEDLRFEIGSIEITGTGSTEALLGVLKPADPQDATAKLWTSLAGLTNAASLPHNALLSLGVVDPRLAHPPKQIRVPQDEAGSLQLLETLANWPTILHPEGLPIFSHKQRHLASKLPTQKALRRRQAMLRAEQTAQRMTTDTSIPVLLLAQRPTPPQSSSQGRWVVMTPWKCIDPIWRSLMYYPLTSGGTPRFGGLQEEQQLAFERNVPWFPGDSPGTASGRAWEQTQSQDRFDAWIRRPPSRRLPYHSVDLGLGRRGEIGRGWSCDWELMLSGVEHTHVAAAEHPAQPVVQTSVSQPTLLTQRQRKAAKAKSTTEHVAAARRRNSSSPESDVHVPGEDHVPQFIQLPMSQVTSVMANPSVEGLPIQPGLVSIKITLLTKGTPDRAARIYRLPKATTLDRSPNESNSTQPAQSRMTQEHPHPLTSPPPAGQPSLATRTSQDSGAPPLDLRSRWLGHYRDTASQRRGGEDGIQRPTAKPRTNRHRLPPTHHVYARPSLNHLHVVPRDAPQEVIDQYGPKPPSEAEIRAQHEADLRVQMTEQAVWDTHIPCPSVNDLIGFVTSGGYNLAAGRGTAIGAVWLQRLVHGWLAEPQVAAAGARQVSSDRIPGPVSHDKSTLDGVDPHPARLAHVRSDGTAAERKQRRQHVERERHLCIVRNAGESIGRLATWEVCE